ncbi:MAG TPA: tyrosinase family protein [Caulobacteraceae bacterium]|nr:tyrosinase family protein [Caulobacteraceae bacterium]
MVIPIDNGVHTREDLWSLDVWDPTLLWYARAMGQMFKKPLQDPSSWRYQAAIHGYVEGDPDLDALMQPGDEIPDDAGAYWAQCQHHGWFFLPWHRAYLGYFERVVRKTIVGLGGPADWALPYWNYSDAAHNADVARLVRPEFIADALPDGTPNPFSRGVSRNPFNTVATPKGQAGDFNIGPNDVRLKCLTFPHFYDHASASSFGGGVTAFSHGEGGLDVEGGVEKTPHDNIHGDIGGWMDSFETAGLDPLFWLHHANIDRLWSVWMAAPGHASPTEPSWLNPAGPGFPYRFHDENGLSQTFAPASVLNSETSPFAYRYQDLHAPPHVMALAAKLQIPAAMTAAPPPTPPQLAGASDVNVDLSAEQVSVELPIQDQAPAINLAAVAGPGPRQAFLNIENVIGSGRLETRYIYLNLPDQTSPDEEPDLYVGSMPMFGVREMSLAAAGGGNGKNFVLNVTDVIRHLQQTGRWNGDLVRVFFVAKNPPTPGSKLTAGRISLYYR